MNASGNGPQAEGAGKREAPGAGPPSSNTGGKSPFGVRVVSSCHHGYDFTVA